MTAFRRSGRRGPHPGPRNLQRRETALREDDLDPAVLRLAHAVRRRHTEVVLAAAGYDHIAARDTEVFESGGDGVGAPLGEPLVVARVIPRYR